MKQKPMQKKFELIIKCNHPSQVAEVLEVIAIQLKRVDNFDQAPNDLVEFDDEKHGTYGFMYDVADNDGTDIYANKIENGDE